ncbi:MAG: adenylylsulfate kinase [Lachnospiraceae bacterium]|nr:adenylylsulfate kinase [Lachnospiraceae bacterium]
MINEILNQIENWIPPQLPESMTWDDVPKGDMPGDKVSITDVHIERAEVLFPLIVNEIKKLVESGQEKFVVGICGGSGAGKSGAAVVLSWYFNELGIGCYNMSGDNYPRRIPKDNDAERIRVYEEGGIEALEAYLGSDQEICFEEVSEVLEKFKAGEPMIALRRMGREEGELWYDEIDFSNIRVLIIEWTHANSDNFTGVDIPVLLNSTPLETMEYRVRRNRDAAADSPFVTMVLTLEQKKIQKQARKAKIILSRQGQILSYDEYKDLMGD